VRKNLVRILAPFKYALYRGGWHTAIEKGVLFVEKNTPVVEKHVAAPWFEGKQDAVRTS
jgi:hypothetical protein